MTNSFILVFLFLLIASKSIRQSYDVIIVGAGMGGVSAASELAKSGKKILILQANNYIGGRMKTQKVALVGGQSLNFELGANWIHGSNPNNPITQLAIEMGTVDLLDSDYQSLLVYDELGVDITQSAKEKNIEYEQVFGRFEQLKPQWLSAEDALKILLPSALHNKQFMFAVSKDFQFDEPASIEYVNAHYIQGRKWMEGVDLLVMSGYQRFAEYLAQKSKAKVLLNHKVTEVIRGDKGDKTTVKCSNGFWASAESVIIGASLGVLKANTIKFTPQLPKWKTEAINKIGFGNLVKILIVPKTPFNLLQPALYLGVVPEDINQRGSATYFLNYQSVPNLTPLMTFGTGANADQLQVMPQAQLKTLIAKRLSVLKASPVSSSDFDIIRSTWKTNPNFRGAYSFSGLQTNIQQWKNMAKPLMDRNWYFCGEHTYYTQRSTVNGAYLSGIAVAKQYSKKAKMNNR